MRILKLVLHLYKRLNLSGISTITYNPTAETQIIIGSNGSGKSSLLDELTPFPPDKTSMLPGGYKTIVIEHQGRVYTIHSEYPGKENKHSMSYVENENVVVLNDRGTASAQKTLIEQHFGVTPEIMDLWIGRTTFTSMPPTKRRDLIIRLSGSDLDYAMRIHNKLRQEFREAQGVEKHYAKRLAEETADTADQNRINELTKLMESYTEDLNQLLSSKEQNIPSMGILKINLNKALVVFGVESDRCLATQALKPRSLYHIPNSMAAVNEAITHYKAEIASRERVLNDLYQERNRVNDILTLMSQSGVDELANLERHNKDLDREISKLIKANPLYRAIEGQDVAGMLGAYKSVKDMVIQLLGELHDNSDGYYNNAKVKECKDSVDKLNIRLSTGHEKLGRLKHELEALNAAHYIDCPKCQHRFIMGAPMMSEPEIRQHIDICIKKIDEIKAQKDELTKYLEGANDYLHQVKSLQRIMADTPALNPLWELLKEQDLFKSSPAKHIPTIVHFLTDLEQCYEIATQVETLKNNERLVKALGDRKTQSDILNEDYVIGLDSKIDQEINTIDDLQVILKDAVDYQKSIVTISDSARLTLNAVKEIMEIFEVLLKAAKNSAIGEVSTQKQVLLANVSAALNTIAKHEAVLVELQQEKAKAGERALDYFVLEKAISPVDGLISTYIQNFIDVFVSDMNNIIDEIWTYPLEILGCSVDSTDVTCKFPISINNGYLRTNDISQGSAGQQDIINFAFKLVMGRYLNLHDYPLYLDELAPTLDEQHRVNLIRFLNQAMETGEYNQMFMISHYASNHFAFVGSEYLVLDDRNIKSKPEVYNKHVEIQYETPLETSNP